MGGPNLYERLAGNNLAEIHDMVERILMSQGRVEGCVSALYAEMTRPKPKKKWWQLWKS